MKYLLPAFLFCFTSCGMISISGNFAGLTSYYKSTKQKIPHLFIKSADSKSYSLPEAQSKIIVTNGKVLSEKLKQLDSSVVYIWSPKCRSTLCVSPSLVQQQSDLRSQKLFVVAEYYDSAMMSIDFNLEHPVTGVDTKFYKTNFTSKYMNRFMNDLTGHNRKDSSGKVLYFFRGTFIRSCTTDKM